MIDLKGKKAIVTGGGRGLGRAVALSQHAFPIIPQRCYLRIEICFIEFRERGRGFSFL